MTISLFLRTFPFVLLRVAAHLAFAAVLLVFLGLMGGVGYALYALLEGASGVLLAVGAFAALGLLGLARLAQRYLLYMIKIAHVAVLAELLENDALPLDADQVAFGKQRVRRHFGGANVAFAVDLLVSGSVRETLRWLTNAAGLLAVIPGVGLVLSLARQVLSLAVNYVDEAVMSYVFSHEEQDVWQAAADGVVLYAQSWRRLLWTATLFVLLVAGLWLVAFFAVLGAGLGLIATMPVDESLRYLYGFLAVAVALVAASVIRWLLVDPLATVAMVVAYNQAIVGQAPSYDLKARLSEVSPRFRTLVGNAGRGPGVLT